MRRSTYTAEEDFTGADRVVPELGEPGGVVRGRARAPARVEAAGNDAFIQLHLLELTHRYSYTC